MLQGREGTASLILMYYRCHTPQTSNLLQCSGCCHCQPSKKIGSKTEASQIATTAPNHSIGDKKRSWRLGDIVNSQPKPMCLCFDSGFKAFLMSHVYLIFILKFRYHKVPSRSTCYYSENQVFGGATNRDMSLNKTCFYSKIQKNWTVSNMPNIYVM